MPYLIHLICHIGLMVKNDGQEQKRRILINLGIFIFGQERIIFSEQTKSVKVTEILLQLIPCLFLKLE